MRKPHLYQNLKLLIINLSILLQKEEVDLCHVTIVLFAILMHLNKLFRIAIRLKRTAVFLLSL